MRVSVRALLCWWVCGWREVVTGRGRTHGVVCAVTCVGVKVCSSEQLVQFQWELAMAAENRDMLVCHGWSLGWGREPRWVDYTQHVLEYRNSSPSSWLGVDIDGELPRLKTYMAARTRPEGFKLDIGIFLSSPRLRGLHDERGELSPKYSVELRGMLSDSNSRRSRQSSLSLSLVPECALSNHLHPTADLNICALAISLESHS